MRPSGDGPDDETLVDEWLELTDQEYAMLLRQADRDGVSPEERARISARENLMRRTQTTPQGSGVVVPLKRP